VVSTGKTYDSKLYIFEELDYKMEFTYLEISAQKVTLDKSAPQNEECVSNPSVSDSSLSQNSIVLHNENECKQNEKKKV